MDAHHLWQIELVAVVILAVMVFEIVPRWLILRRAGFSGWWSLFHFIPLVGLVLFGDIILDRPTLNP